MITINLKSIILTGAVSVFALTSCTKKIDEAYLNPNAPTKVPVESILPGVIGGFTAFNSAAGTNFGLQIDNLLIGRYTQYWGSTTNGENYGMMGGTMGSDNTGGIWGTVYFGQGQNINKIIEWGTEDEKWDYVGVAWAIRAWGWLELTNQYGDAILKQAFNTNLSQFNYDTQPEFYDSVRTICHRSLGFLSRTDGKVSPANLALGDAYFNNGDVNKWKKFVYGLLARSYIDLSNKPDFVTGFLADSAIKYANLAMTVNADDATAEFQANTNHNGVNNYFGPLRSNLGALRQGGYVTKLMTGANTSAFTGVFDPRCWYMLSENNNGTFKGVTPWLGVSEYLTGTTPTADYPKNFWRHPTNNQTVAPATDTSRYVYSNAGPWPIMTASEMQFVLAEAYHRKGNKPLAYTAYQNAISLNFDMLTTIYNKNIPAGKEITPASKAAYMGNTAIVPATSAGLTLTHIMLQKYIALYAWGTHQTWIDMRKFHYTAIDAETGKQVYADFLPPPTTPTNYLISTNLGKWVYRCRPRYNSEYLYNIPELTRIGALNQDYVTKECWFSLP